ncbi:MAG: GMP/IMP nucleotidase [Gammaproteobacteria bacterium]|nr:GMP/IMP nucleotidase [Gammaproteobacteria bacterium]MDH3464966.1 GMP/IMP nucleotidase [Gammaproteobacteria bacterium]
MTVPAIQWHRIDVVLLDLDGTLLDLNYDNVFWLQHVPKRFAELHSMSAQQALSELRKQMRHVEGSLNWYCVDYWSAKLGLDIAALKREIKHLIAVRPGVELFLQRLQLHHKQVRLVTNAHITSLDLKMQCTGLDDYFDRLQTSHALGAAKEHRDFWLRYQNVDPFDPQRALLIDDNFSVLQAARDYGLAELRGIRFPDSAGPERQSPEFHCVDRFEDIMPRIEVPA